MLRPTPELLDKHHEQVLSTACRVSLRGPLPARSRRTHPSFSRASSPVLSFPFASAVFAAE